MESAMYYWITVLLSNLTYGCQEHCVSRYHNNLTSYWRIMMADNWHYLYMLNNYEISTYWTKNNGNTCLSNGKYSGLSLVDIQFTCNKLIIPRWKTYVCSSYNSVLMDVFTSEDGLKHWYQQSHLWKSEVHFTVHSNYCML
jgi:hypothetical protein